MTRRESILAGLGAAVSARSEDRPRYTVCIIGDARKGGFGHHWDMGWNRLPNVEVLAVADPSEEGRLAAQRNSGAKRVYADWGEMLEREHPAIVNIAVRWSDERLIMFRAAANLGAHILVEKPFAPTLRDADEMAAMAAQRGIKVQVGHQHRASQRLRRIVNMVRAGEIGELVEIRTRGKEDQRAGGEDLAVLGTHSLDLLRCFAGDPGWVFADITQNGKPAVRKDRHEGGAHVGPLAGDQVAAMFGFNGGLHGYFGSRLGTPYPPETRCGPFLMGTKGVIHIDVGSSRSAAAQILRSPMWMAGTAGFGWEEIPGDGPEVEGTFDAPANGMARDLIAAIEQQRDPICSEKDGCWTIEMLTAIYRSHFTESKIRFPLADRSDPFVS